MSVLNLPKTGHAVSTLPTANHAWSVTVPSASWISISSTPAGDPVTPGDFRFARLHPGVTYNFPAKGTDVFISGCSTDPNADVAPTALTYLDQGAAT